MLFPSGCACNPRGRPAKPKPRVRPCCVHQTNILAPKTARGRMTGVHNVTHKKALPQRTDDCIHPCRFAHAGSFLQFILPTAADEGRRTAFFVGVKGACADLDRRPLSRRTGRQDGRFLKRLGRLFSGFGALFLNRNGREAVLALPLPLAKTDQDCRRRRIETPFILEQTVPAGFAVFAEIYAFSFIAFHSSSNMDINISSAYSSPSLTASLKTPSILNPAFKYTFSALGLKE